MSDDLTKKVGVEIHVERVGTGEPPEEKIAKNIRNITEVLGKWETEAKQATATSEKLTQAEEKQKDTADRLAKSNANLGSSFGTMQKAARYFILTMQSLAGSFLIRQVVQAGIEYSRIINTLTAGTGSVHRAGEEFKFISGLVQKLGLNFFAISESYARFLASVAGTPVAGQKARDIFRAVAEATVVLGLSGDRVNKVFLALQQMASKVVISAQDLRRQFSEHIPGAMILAARAMNMTNSEFYTMMRQGKILAGDLLPKLAAELEKVYGATAERAANTMIGVVNRLATAWQLFLVSLSEGEFGAALKEAMGSITAMLNDIAQRKTLFNDLAGAVGLFSSGIQWAAQNIGVLSDAFKLWISFRIAEKLTGWATAASSMGAAALKAGQATGTFGSALGALGATIGTIAIAGLIYWILKLKEKIAEAQAQINLMVTLQAQAGQAFTVVHMIQAKVRQPGFSGNVDITQTEAAAVSADQAKRAIELRDAAIKEAEAKQRVLNYQKQIADLGIKMTEDDPLGKKFAELQKDAEEAHSKTTVLAQDYRHIADAMGRANVIQEATNSSTDEAVKMTKEQKTAVDAYRDEYIKLGNTITQNDLKLAEVSGKQDDINKAAATRAKWEEEALRLQRMTTEEVFKEFGPRSAILANAQRLAGVNSEIDISQRQQIKNAEDQKVLDDQRTTFLKESEQAMRTIADLTDDAKNKAAEAMTGLFKDFETPVVAATRRAEDAVRNFTVRASNLYAQMFENAMKSGEGIDKEELAALEQFWQQAGTDAGTIYASTFSSQLRVELVKDFNQSMGGAIWESLKNSLESMQRSFENFFTNVLRNGDLTWKSLWDEMKDLGAKLVATLLTQWIFLERTKTATTAFEAAKRAAIERAASQGGSASLSGSDWWGVIKSFFTNKATAGKSGDSSGGSGGLSSIASGLYKYGLSKGWWGNTASTGLNATYSGNTATISGSVGSKGATSGLSAGGFNWSAFGAGIAFAVVMAIGMKQSADERNRLRFDTGAQLGFSNGRFNAAWGGKLSQTGQGIADSLANTANSLIDATGVFVEAAKTAQIAIRNDKKIFMVTLTDGATTAFATANEAILAAVKDEFLNSKFIGSIDPVVREAIRGFSGDAKDFGPGIEWLKSIVAAAKGLSDVAVATQGLPAQIEATIQKMRDLGVSMKSAVSTGYQWGAMQFLAARRQITGEQETPAQQLARRKQEALIFNATLAIEKAEIQAKIAGLKAQAAGNIVQIEIWNDDLKGRRVYLGAQDKGNRAQQKIWADLIKAYDDAAKIFDSIKPIDVSGLKPIGGGAGRGTRTGGSSAGTGSTTDNFWDIATGDLSPLDPMKKMAAAKLRYEAALAGKDKGELEAARQMYLDLAQKVYGGTAMYAQIFAQVMQQTKDLGALTDREKQARELTIDQLWNLARTANVASSALAKLLGIKMPKQTTAGLKSLGPSSLLSGNLGPIAEALGGNIDTTGGTSALQSNTYTSGTDRLISTYHDVGNRTVNELKQVSSELKKIRKSRNTGGSASILLPSPSSPPPPDGSTTTFGGGGSFGGVDRGI